MSAASRPSPRALLSRRRIRLLVSMLVLYSLLLTLAIAATRSGAPAPLRYPTAALPALPLTLLVAGQVRATRDIDIDDASARARLEALVWGIGLGSVLVFAYGLLQFAGAPMVNWAFAWPVYGVTWLAAHRLLQRRRRNERLGTDGDLESR